MFVCICKSVTDKQIRRAALNGVDTLYELHQELGVASGCGSCADSAQEILDEVAGNYAGPQVYVPSSA